MQVTDVRAVIAIGLSGQFGLHGRVVGRGRQDLSGPSLRAKAALAAAKARKAAGHADLAGAVGRMRWPARRRRRSSLPTCCRSFWRSRRVRASTPLPHNSMPGRSPPLTVAYGRTGKIVRIDDP